MIGYDSQEDLYRRNSLTLHRHRNHSISVQSRDGSFIFLEQNACNINMIKLLKACLKHNDDRLKRDHR
jgi:hypothetical protein